MVGPYILAGLRLREVVGLLGILGAVAVAGAIMAPYRLQRVKVWLDPWSDEANTGYQMAPPISATIMPAVPISGCFKTRMP